MGLRRRLRALDDSFESRVDKVAPTERGKERLGFALGVACVVIIGSARFIAAETSAWVIVVGSMVMVLVVAGHLRYQRRRREQR